jgi:hypothetical protein
MRFAMPQITTLVLLVHMGLGCCWHHAHACALPGFSTHAAFGAVHDDGPPSESSHHPCDRHDRAGSSVPADQDEHKHPCEGDRCTFVRSKPASELDRDLDASACSAATNFASPEPLVLSPCLLTQADLAPANRHGPLRMHLLLRVLLI